VAVNGHREKKNEKEKEKKREKKIDARIGVTFIHSFCSSLLFSSVDRAHIPSNFIAACLPISLRSRILYDNNNNNSRKIIREKKHTERKEVSMR
jgi:hypothetical protein